MNNLRTLIHELLKKEDKYLDKSQKELLVHKVNEDIENDNATLLSILHQNPKTQEAFFKKIGGYQHFP